MPLARAILRALTSPRGLWAAVGCVAVALGLWGAQLAFELAQADRPAEPPAADPLPLAAARDGALSLRLAGSGSNVAGLRQVVLACQRQGQDLRLQVEPGIGSAGGLRALRDGAIDAALVSRHLAAGELQGAEVQTVYARAAVTFAAARRDGDSADGLALLAALASAAPRWPDGRPLTWLLREPGDSGHRVVAQNHSAFAAIEARARRDPAAQVYFHDRTLHAALVGAEAAVGLVDASAVRAEGLPLSLSTWGGATPDAATVQAGAWPHVKPHSLVYPIGAAPRLQALLACLGSPAGREALVRLGAAPMLP